MTMIAKKMKNILTNTTTALKRIFTPKSTKTEIPFKKTKITESQYLEFIRENAEDIIRTTEGAWDSTDDKIALLSWLNSEELKSEARTALMRSGLTGVQSALTADVEMILNFSEQRELNEHERYLVEMYVAIASSFRDGTNTI